MKRFIVVFMAAILLVGCSGGTQTDIEPAKAAETILNGVSFRDELIEAEGDVAREWYSLDDKVKDFAIYVSGSGATAEEIAVIKSDDVKTAKATIEKRVADLEFRFKDYMPAEMTKINNPVIVTKGDLAVLVLCDDAEAARKVVDGLFK